MSVAPRIPRPAAATRAIPHPPHADTRSVGVRMRDLAVLLALAAIVLAPVGARAGTPAQDLAWLNAKREASGIPGGITENPAWSAACAQHLAYMRRTATITHAEDPASPYFTEQGNWAGTHAVLASTTTWTEDTFIWEYAPLHLAQLLAPQLSEVGIADDGQFVCVTTWPGYLRVPPSGDGIVAYPGPGLSIYASETAAEEPTTPGAALGLGTPTGPHIYAFLWGPSAVGGMDASGAALGVRTATVTGPDGPVALRWVDQRTPDVGRYLPTGAAILIPTQPLDRDTSYIASITYSNGVARAWSFVTSVARPHVVRGVRVAVRPTGRRLVCIVGTPSGCRRRALRYTARVRIAGRVLDRAAPPNGTARAAVVIGIDRVERPLLRTGADGRFSQTLFVERARRRAAFLITIRAEDCDLYAQLVSVDLASGRRRVPRQRVAAPPAGLPT